MHLNSRISSRYPTNSLLANPYLFSVSSLNSCCLHFTSSSERVRVIISLHFICSQMVAYQHGKKIQKGYIFIAETFPQFQRKLPVFQSYSKFRKDCTFFQVRYSVLTERAFNKAGRTCAEQYMNGNLITSLIT